MVRVASVGGYVPCYRIRRSAVAEQHGDDASGETAVPGRDETLVTMASEATGTALKRSTPNDTPPDVGAVFTASVSDPFAEHGLAAHVAYRHGLDGDLRTGDFRGSPRAATDALATGRRYVQATDESALVVGADAMPVERGHDDEAYSGAGAGAVVLAPGNDGEDGNGGGDDASDGIARTAARIHGIGQRTTGFVERHREHGRPAESGDRRFEGEHGFGDATPEAVSAALGTAPAMPSKAVVAVPDARLAKNAVAEFPGDVARVATFDSVGYAGAATFYLDLAHLVESADADTTAVAVSYGAGGVDAVALTTGADGGPTTAGDGGSDRGHAANSDLTVAEQLDAKEYVTYAQHLHYRERPDYEEVSL